ncbi:hypothetical protein X730_19520 [Mesorhizobium sp. L103C565B0]|nr:hypothetical protein X730_19520 [Mesorhizobium sp. L103C565B0]
MGGAEMTPQRPELLAILEAVNEIRRYRALAVDRGLRRRLRRSNGIVHGRERCIDALDQRRQAIRRH